MPHSEAVQELIQQAKFASRVLHNDGKQQYDCVADRLDATVAAVEAEEKPQRHSFRPSFSMTPEKCSFRGCGQPANAPIHQIGGKS